MNVAIVKIGEPLPGEGFRERRVTRLIEKLSSCNYDVTWITSNWSHQAKRRRSSNLVKIASERGFSLKLVDAVGYRKNISIYRAFHHWQFSKQLKQELFALHEKQPLDVIWCCFPTIGACRQAVNWANEHNVPIIIDIRDLSPDVLVSRLPYRTQRIVSTLLTPTYRKIAATFARATGVTAVSQGYLDWGLELAGGTGKASVNSRVLPLGYRKEIDFLTVNMPKFFQDSNSIKVVYAGGLGSSYDLSTLIKGVNGAIRHGVKVELYICGGGENENALKNEISNIPSIHYLGWLNGKELAYVLSKCDIGAMAYSENATQGLPNKIFEYMGNRLMIINSLNGESRNLIETHEVGLCYEPGDSQTLTEILIKIDRDRDLLSTYKENAYKLFDREYEETQALDSMIDFISENIQRKKRA